VVAVSPFDIDRDSLNMDSDNYLDISRQDFRGLTAKSVEVFSNVCSFNFIIICITETWLHKSFPTSCGHRN
jgi:hypothetical protein